MSDRYSLGVEGLDDILCAAVCPEIGCIWSKVTPAWAKPRWRRSFCSRAWPLANRGLYVTLSETQEELKSVAQSHGWSLDGLPLFELSSVEEQLAADAKQYFAKRKCTVLLLDDRTTEAGDLQVRSGGHEATIRELRIGRGGVQVGEPLSDFQGVLTGTPHYVGKSDKMINS